ncbi:TonB-dependent receptor plug domain-containing protein [Nonlabens sp.]|uniref:TonB-dependent receptor plug domain-containing protein n=1 Tax=Nonlabens sp. TaxID=1888209 RepID=UPI003F699D2E
MDQPVTNLINSKAVMINEEGYAYFNSVNQKELQLYIAGYKIIKYTVTGSESDCIQLDLESDINLLAPVVLQPILTSGIYHTDRGDIKINVSQYGSLAGLSSPDALESIQSLPAIESTDETISNINVRGGGNDENLIIWDGIKMYHTGHFFGLISAFNPYALNDITVIKNGTDASLGDSVSSTILMNTNDEILGKFEGTIGLDLLSADTRLTLPISKKLETHIALRRSITDGVRTPTFELFAQRSFQNSQITGESNESNNINSAVNFSFYDANLKLLYDVNKNHQLRFNGIHISNDLIYDEQLLGTSPSQIFQSNLNQTNTGLSASYTGKLSSKLTINAMAYLSQFNVNASDSRISSNQRLEQLNEVIENGVKFNASYQFNNATNEQGKNITLNTGYHFYELGTLNSTVVDNPAFSSRIKQVLLNHATWAQLSIHKPNAWEVITGIRSNYYQDFNRWIIEPRINTHVKLSPSVTLSARGEFKSQSIAQIIDYDNDFLGVENRRWRVADEQGVPIITSLQASSELNYHKKNTTLKLEAFHKQVNDITAQSRGLFSNLDTDLSLGDYRSTGVELFAQQRLQKVNAWMSYTYSVNDFNFQAFTPPDFPATTDSRHSIQTSITYVPHTNLELSVGAQYRTGLPFTRPITSDPTRQDGSFTLVNFDGTNQSRLPDYFRLDATVKYQFQLGENDLSLQLGLRNITNYRNKIERFYSVSSQDGSVVENINFGLPFTPNISLRYQF